MSQKTLPLIECPIPATVYANFPFLTREGWWNAWSVSAAPSSLGAGRVTTSNKA